MNSLKSRSSSTRPTVVLGSQGLDVRDAFAGRAAPPESEVGIAVAQTASRHHLADHDTSLVVRQPAGGDSKIDGWGTCRPQASLMSLNR
jgi:hypothetical protein